MITEKAVCGITVHPVRIIARPLSLQSVKQCSSLPDLRLLPRLCFPLPAPGLSSLPVLPLPPRKPLHLLRGRCLPGPHGGSHTHVLLPLKQFPFCGQVDYYLSPLRGPELQEAEAKFTSGIQPCAEQS